MTIEITEAAGHVSAMGHKVSLESGGHAELRRRCLEQLARLNEPPDEIRFERESAPEAGSARPALVPPPPDPVLDALPDPLEPADPEPEPPRAPLLTPAETPRAKRRPGR
jgi:hypothetical protein